MKIYDFTEKNDDNVATYYICVDGDIHDTLIDAEVTGCIAEIKVHGMYVGSAEDMRRNAHRLYKEEVTK